MQSTAGLLLALSTVTLALPARNELYEMPYGSDYMRPMAYEELDPRLNRPLGGSSGHLINRLEQALRNNPYYFNRDARNLDSLSGITFGENKRFDPSIPAFGSTKRNMDEIDRTGFDSFIKKRNFDEIDRTGFDGFVKKRTFDEIDRVGFGSFIKRQPQHNPSEPVKN